MTEAKAETAEDADPTGTPTADPGAELTQSPGDEQPVLFTGSVSVKSKGSDTFSVGDSVTLVATIANPNVSFEIRWEADRNDGNGWGKLQGENDTEYSFVLEADNADYRYRVVLYGSALIEEVASEAYSIKLESVSEDSADNTAVPEIAGTEDLTTSAPESAAPGEEAAATPAPDATDAQNTETAAPGESRQPDEQGEAETPVPAPEETETPEETTEPQAPAEAEPTVTYEYLRDESGALLLDENGNPIPILPEGATQKPVAWQRDENNRLVLDENGYPIPVQFLPVEAVEPDSSQDAIDTDHHAGVCILWEDDNRQGYGEDAILTAVLVGYDNLVYSLLWQSSSDGETFADVEGATGMEYTTTVTEENVNDLWRVAITVTDVIE